MILRVALVLLSTLILAVGVNAQSPANPRLDALGDPLPDGAIARLGTLRFKHTPAGDPTIDVAMYSPDGKKAVSLVYGPGSIRVWDTFSGKEIAGPWSTSKQGGYSAVAFSPDSTLLAVSGRAAVRKAKEGKEQPISEIVLYDIALGKPAATLKVEVLDVRALGFADGGKTLIAAGNGAVAWCDIAAGTAQRTWKPFADEKQPGKDGGIKIKTFETCVIGAGGASLAVNALWRDEKADPRPVSNQQVDQEAIGYNLASGAMTWRLASKGPNNGELRTRFAYSSDGKRVAIATGTNKVEVRDTVTGKLVASPLEGKTPASDFPGGLAISADGGVVALAGGNSRVSVWNVDSPAAPRQFTARIAQYWNASTRCLDFSPDGKTLLVGADADVQFYDVATLEETRPWDGHRGWIDFVFFSADGKRLLTGSADINFNSQELAVWDAASWKRLGLASLRTPPWPNLGFASPDLTTYTGKAGDERLALYDFKSGGLLARFSAPAGQGGQMRGFYSPGGRHYLLSAKDEKGKAVDRLYAVPSGKALGNLPSVASVQRSMISVRPIAFTPDERMVALFGQEDSLIHVFDTATCKLHHRLGTKQEASPNDKRREAAYNLAFAPDGKHLASWSMTDPFIRIWDMATGKEVLQVSPSEPGAKRLQQPGDRGHVYFAWSPDSRVLAVGQNKIHLWELASLGIRRELPGHQEGSIRGLAFSPDGRVLASGSADTTVLIWDAAEASAPGLVASDVETRWRELAEDDAGKAYAAIRALAAAPGEAVAWIKERVQPAQAVDTKRIGDLIEQLDDGQFKVRQAAMAELLRAGESAVPAIDRALAGQPALETHLRLQDVRKRVSGLVLKGQRLQAYRALEVLERIGTPEARQVLQTLAGGEAGVLLTTQARGALERLRE